MNFYCDKLAVFYLCGKEYRYIRLPNLPPKFSLIVNRNEIDFELTGRNINNENIGKYEPIDDNLKHKVMEFK